MSIHPSHSIKTWNDKYLDYEIETDRFSLTLPETSETWNDKYLDYEIETLSEAHI